MPLELDDLIENIKADIRELNDRLGRHAAYLQINVLNIMEFERRTQDAYFKYDRR